MSSILRIEGDPTSWTLTAAIDAGQVLMSGAPVAVPVSAPLAGRLLLSPRAVGSVAYLHVLDDRSPERPRVRRDDPDFHPTSNVCADWSKVLA